MKGTANAVEVNVVYVKKTPLSIDNSTSTSASSSSVIYSENDLEKFDEATETNVYDESHAVDTEDVAKLSSFSEAPLLASLKRRFLDLNIYTYVSDVLIALNPYFPIDHLNDIPDQLVEFEPEQNPHSYAIAQFAFQRQHRRHQSVIVSGESGQYYYVFVGLVLFLLRF